MSSGFPGGVPDLFSGNMNGEQQFTFRTPVPGSLPDPAAQIRRQDWIGKRSLADFQHQNQGFGFYLRNMKPRNGGNYYRQHASPKSTLYPVDFPYGSPEFSAVNPRYGQHRVSMNNGRVVVANNSGPEISARDQMAMMSDKLQELEKQLLDDDDDGEPVSDVTNSEWSDTIQDLMGPARKPISLSPASSSSSCSSTSASPPLPCSKQTLIDAAEAISEGKPDSAAELLTRLQQKVANSKGTPEQRLVSYMVTALSPRVSHTRETTAAELGDKEHEESTQMLFDASPCFKLCFMAANMAILESMAEQGFENVHVVDFNVGQGGQYVHLLHALSAKNPGTPSLTITAFADSGAGEEKLKIVGDGLRSLAERVGVCLTFKVKNPNANDLTRESLQIRPGEALAVNFSFKLYHLPDESVTTENIRDLTLRRVKALSPEIMTVVEQEMNTNTAPLCARVKDAWEYYRLLFDSLDSTMPRDNPDRFRIEEGLGRKICNSVGCEGPDRVERCEVFGKWRARLSMAGFEPRPVGKTVVDSLRVKVNSVTRGNPGFSVNEESGGIGFGWMGRNLTVASAWR